MILTKVFRFLSSFQLALQMWPHSPSPLMQRNMQRLDLTKELRREL